MMSNDDLSLPLRWAIEDNERIIHAVDDVLSRLDVIGEDLRA